MISFIFRQRVLVCVVVFFAAFGLSCKPKSTEQADANKPQPTPAKIEAEAKADVNLVEPQTPEEPADNVAVTVNGVDITEAELQKLMRPQLEKMAQQSAQLPPAFAQTLEKQIRQHVLNQLIVGRLLDEKVKEANIVTTDEEVTKQIEQMASAQRPPLSVEELKNIVENQGYVFDDWKNEIRKQLGQQKLFRSQSSGSINVTEEDAKKYYDENPTQFEVKEQVRASHILIKPDITDPNNDPNQAKAKIEGLLKQIKDGADFAELAKANSACPSAAQGGDLNFFPRGKMAAPFEKAAFELEVGKVSDIVETQFGYHIIKVTGHKDAGTTLFEQARDNIIKQLTRKKQSEFVNKYIDSLKAEANIVYPPGKEPTPPAPAPVFR